MTVFLLDHHGLIQSWGGPSRQLRRITAYLFPLLGLVNVWLLVRFAEQVTLPVPWKPALSGLLFIAGGATFDLSVTLAISPSLELEGNPYARVLLDSGHSLGFVYAYMLLSQAMFVSLFCGVWIGFLKHRSILVETIVAANPRNGFDFLKAATGGGQLSHRQWLLPLNWSEFSLMYHSIWATAVAVVFGISLFRWYAGIEWLGLVEVSSFTRLGVITTGVTGSLVLYFQHLWRCFQSTREHINSSTSAIRAS